MKFRIKITLCMVGLLSVLFGTGGSILLQASYGHALEQEQQEAYSVYQLTADLLQTVGSINGSLIYEDIAETVSRVEDRKNIRTWDMIRVRTDKGTIYESGSTKFSPAAVNPTKGKCEVSYHDSGDRQYLYLSETLVTDREPVCLDMSIDVSDTYERRQSWMTIYRWVFVVIMTLAAAVSYALAGVLTRPLHILSETSAEIAGGDLTVRADVRTGDEVGELADEFNHMAGYLEETVRKLEEEIKGKERFIGNFSHELKTPMTSIIGYADLIRGGTLEQQELMEAADYIVKESKRLERLSMKLLDLSVIRHADIRFRMISPGSLLRELLMPLVPACAEKGVRLTFSLQEGTCGGEPDLICLLVRNLVENSFHALSESGGNVWVRLRMTGDGCRIFVCDDGTGIPEESIRHLTEAFYRVDRSRARKAGGTGIGLALCREIAELHGGALRFRSRMGEGTAVLAFLRGGRQ